MSQNAVIIRWWCPEKIMRTWKPIFELAAKGVFRLGRCYIFWRGVLGLWASYWESTATDGWSSDWLQQIIYTNVCFNTNNDITILLLHVYTK